MAKNETKVSISLHRRMRFMMASLGPVAAWVAAVVIAGVLVTNQTKSITVRGLSAQDTTIITSTIDGRLLSMPHHVLDTVNQGDVVGVLDDSFLRSELAIIHAEAALLQARVEAEREKLRVEQIDSEQEQNLELRRLSVDLGRAKLDALDRRVDMETTRIEVQRLKADIARFETLSENGYITPLHSQDLRFQLEASEKFIQETTTSLEVSERQIEEATDRLNEYQERVKSAEPMQLDVIVAALEAEEQVITKRIKSAEIALTNLVMRSPFAGRVTAVHTHSGSEIKAGFPLVEIVNDQTNVVVAWLPDNSEIVPQTGDEAVIRQLGVDGSPTVGKVEEVAGSVIPLPVQLLRESSFPEYGTPVRISVPEKAYPTGSKVQVTFTQGSPSQ